jgi:pyrroline-5-carboxylate reductase
MPAVSMAERLGAERILQAVGSTLWIADETQMDAVTAVSGSGPAYVFLFIEALQQAGKELGLTPAQARQLSIETVLGAAKLAAQSDEASSVLRERVTSKGGTTEAALRRMDERGVKEGFIAGVLAASARGRELGELLGQDAG